jgi:hypothetical protein
VGEIVCSGSFAGKIESHKCVLLPRGDVVISFHMTLHALGIFSMGGGSDGFVFVTDAVFLGMTSQAPFRSLF